MNDIDIAYRNKHLDENKICFITCVNDKDQYARCCEYIGSLILPDNMKMDGRAVYGAASITAGYQDAMEKSDAKYKIYLHQDVWIITFYFIEYVVNFFRTHPSVGIAGVVGSDDIAPSGAWWEGNRIGMITDTHRNGGLYTDFYSYGGEKAVLLDGLLLATQYDVPWRKDLFTGAHFYDVSQCLEFHRHGYEAAVFPQQVPWCVHWCSSKSRKDYYEQLPGFVKEYAAEFEQFKPR